jgi:hypothetical protein
MIVYIIININTEILLHPVLGNDTSQAAIRQSDGFPSTQLYFNSFLLFYSTYPLHVSVVRPSSSGNIYIGN